MISSNSSSGIKAPVWVKDGNFRLSTRFLEHQPVITPPTNQKSYSLQPSSQILLFKTSPWKPSGSLETLRRSICSSCLAQQHISLHSKLCFGLFGLTVWHTRTSSVTLAVRTWCADYLVHVAKIPVYLGPFLTTSEQFFKAKWEAVFWLKSTENLSNSTKSSAFMFCFLFFFSIPQ